MVTRDAKLTQASLSGKWPLGEDFLRWLQRVVAIPVGSRRPLQASHDHKAPDRKRQAEQAEKGPGRLAIWTPANLHQLGGNGQQGGNTQEQQQPPGRFASV